MQGGILSSASSTWTAAKNSWCNKPSIFQREVQTKVFCPRTLYLSKIFSPLGQYPPLQPWRVHYLLISRPKKTMAQCRVSPRARVSACPGTMLHHTKSAGQWWAENRLRTRHSPQIFSCALLRMLKQYLHLKLKMSFRGNCTNIFIMQENILEIFFN